MLANKYFRLYLLLTCSYNGFLHKRYVWMYSIYLLISLLNHCPFKHVSNKKLSTDPHSSVGM